MSSWPSPTCTIPIPYHCLPAPLPSYIRVPASLHPSSPHIITTPHHNRHMALPPHTITIAPSLLTSPSPHMSILSPHCCPPSSLLPAIIILHYRSLCCRPAPSLHCSTATLHSHPPAPAQPCATSTQLPPTLRHPVLPSVPHGIFAQHPYCPLAVITLHQLLIPPLRSRPALSPPHTSHPIPSTPCNFATTTVPPPP